MIDDYISDVCNILNINIPLVSFDTSKFQTKTMMAQCLSDGSVIYIRKTDKPDPDYFFAIAHELRHVWQIKTDKRLYFSNYKTIDILGVEKYNLQLAELDANAFAMSIMQDFFGLQAQFSNLPDYIKRKIYDRSEII